MSEHRYRLILNGRSDPGLELPRAIAEARGRGQDIEVVATRDAGDAVRLAREAADHGFDTVIAAGGDGTLNEVIAGVVAATIPPESDVEGEIVSEPPSCSVGLIPIGTANDFAQTCGLPLDDAEACLRLILDTEPRAIDLGVAGERVFANVASGGIGTKVTVETPDEMKRVLGKLAYFLTGLTRFGDIQAAEGRVHAPGFEWQGSFLGIAVGNGRQAGGGIRCCPHAVLDDGLLDLTILPEVSAGERLTLLNALVTGTTGELDEVVIGAQVPWAEVESDIEVYFNLDGEPTRGTSFRFEVRPRALRFHLPHDAPLVA